MKNVTWFAVALCLAFPAVLAGASVADAAGNWPQWRGPQATGVAPGARPPVEWSESSNVRWKVSVPGKGLSAPIVWEDLVLVTTAVEVDAEKVAKPEPEAPPPGRRGPPPVVSPSGAVEFAVVAFDRGTGKVRWRKTLRKAVPHEGTHIDASWASASAVTDGETIIAHFGSNGTYALNMKGDLAWERDLGQMATRRSFGEGSSPALHGNAVVINWDHEGPSFIVVLDRKTGKTLWKKDRDEPTSWSTPLVVEQGGKPQVVVAATQLTRGYDLQTGEVLWKAGGMTTNTIPSPVYAGGRVFVMSGFRGNALQAIDLAKAGGDVTGSDAVAWTYDRDTPYVPSPLLYDGRLYFLKSNNGILSCFDAATGKARYGPQRLEGIEGVYASPVGAAGRVYIVGRNGTTLVIEHGDEFKVLATNVLEDGFDASPAVAGDELYLRGRAHLYCIAAGGGSTSD